MSEFKKKCTTCGLEIILSQISGGAWKPFNKDNSPHRCSTNGHARKVSDSDTLSIDERVERLEKFLGIQA